MEILELAYPIMMDWARCLAELRSEGWTPYRVAHHLGADPPTVYGWANGREPRHSYGAALIVLHRTICGIDCSQKLYSAARIRA